MTTPNDPDSWKRGNAAPVLMGVATTLLWLWDISWQATFPESESWPPPRILTILVCIIWAMVSGVVNRASRPRLALAILGGGLVGGAVFAGLSAPEPGASGTGYLNGPTILLSLAVGLLSVLTLHTQVKISRDSRGQRSFLTVLTGGLVVLWLSTMSMDYTGWPNLWRGPEFLVVAGGLFGLPLAFMARAVPARLTATATAFHYLLLLVLSGALFHGLSPTWFSPAASPERFVLHAGPLLLFLPGLVTDWLQGRTWLPRTFAGDTLLSVAVASAFVATLWIGHWYWAGFFVPSEGVGRGLAVMWWPVGAMEGDWNHRYWTLVPGQRRWAQGIVGALLATALSVRVGLRLGSHSRNESNAS